MTATMQAYVYVRFSTTQQEPGSSKDRQLESCRTFIRERGWQEVEVVYDLGVSAWKGAHLSSGNLGKFASRLRTGEIPAGSVIVVEQIDRLSRQEARKTQRWIEDICDLGYKIATAADGRVYDAQSLNANLADLLLILVQGQAANDYVETLSRRAKGSIQKRLKDARETGAVAYGNVPGWLKVEVQDGERKILQRPERVGLVREIFDLTIAGLAPWKIAAQFNARGTPSFTGKPWERAYIVKVIRSPAVEGDLLVGEGKVQIPTGEVLKGYYGKAVVPADIVTQARATLDRRRTGKGRNSESIHNLFGQKVRCGSCGGRMMLVGYQSRYLTCYEASRRNACCQTATFKYRNLEAAALDGLLPLALDERFFRQAAEANSFSREIAETEKAIRDKENEANRFVDILGRMVSEAIEARLAQTERERAQLKLALADLRQRHAVAEGIATAEKHLERLVAVREALSHPQDDIRLPARLRVSEALQALVDEVCCDLVGPDATKRFALRAVGGLHVVTYDNDGKELSRIQPDVSANGDVMVTDRHVERYGEPDDRLETYIKRRHRVVLSRPV